MSPSADRLARLLGSSEDDLMGRILAHAERQGYTRYTSTLEEAWRLSIAGLSEALLGALRRSEEVPELHPDERYQDDLISLFGVLEARRHRERGVSLEMFLGLFKYYRQSYVDLVADADLEPPLRSWARRWIGRSFDRMEIAFVAQWSRQGQQEQLAELQSRNRSMTNEKNRLLTVVESLSTPAILIDEQDRVVYWNAATSRLVQQDPAARSEYYQAPANPFQDPTAAAGAPAARITAVFPWLEATLAGFRRQQRQDLTAEVCVCGEDGAPSHYAVQLTRMRDVSGKYPGTVILIADVSVRRQAEDQVRQLNVRLGQRNQELTEALDRIESLEGILPICASCKKIRDEDGRWVQMEVYIRDRTRADFSHGICPECGERLYGRRAGDLPGDDER